MTDTRMATRSDPGFAYAVAVDELLALNGHPFTGVPVADALNKAWVRFWAMSGVHSTVEALGQASDAMDAYLLFEGIQVLKAADGYVIRWNGYPACSARYRYKALALLEALDYRAHCERLSS